MHTKQIERDKAIQLRMDGKTYTEILSAVKVAKSTLSIWLSEVHLSQKQKQRITEIRKWGQIKGARMRRNTRIFVQENIYENAVSEIELLTLKDLWYM